MNAAETLRRALKGNQGRAAQPVTDEFAKAIARQLERRGIAKVPGVPSPGPEPTWIDNAIEYGERTRELEAKWAAQRQAAQDEHTTPQTAAAALRAAIAGPSAPLPLNGAGILRAALGGGRGTINGDGQ